MSCFIVVLTVSLMVSVLTNAPVAWLRLAELSSGELGTVHLNSDELNCSVRCV